MSEPATQPTSDTTAPSRDEMTAAALGFYAENFSRKYVRKKLLAAGGVGNDVDAVVEEAWGTHKGNQRFSGLIALGLGVLMLFVGLAVTFGTMNRAQAGGGGSVVVMRGLILFGAISLIRGLIKLIIGR